MNDTIISLSIIFIICLIFACYIIYNVYKQTNKNDK